MNTPVDEARKEMQALLERAGGGMEALVGHGADVEDLSPGRIVEVLTPLMTAGRRARIEEILRNRTTTVVPVVEGIINTGNVNAVMRSAEALGYQAFHVIKNDPDGDATYKTSKRTSQGAEKWLDVHLWDRPAPCAANLREHGYRIVVTHLSDQAEPIDAFDFTEKTALVFGNEKEGITPAMLQEADAECILPIEGFTQSYNISVAAAMCLYHAYRDRLRHQGVHGDLTEAERTRYRAIYYLKSVNRAVEVVREIQKNVDR